MQAAFTKKTQEIATERKAAQEYKTRAEAYSKYEKYVPIIEEMLGAQTAPQVSPEMVALERQLKDAGYSDEAIEMAKISGNFLLKTFAQQRQAEKQLEEQTRASERFNSSVAEAEKLDPRLNDSSLVYQMEDGSQVTFGDLVATTAAADPEVHTNPVLATKRAIAKLDALVTRAKQEGKEELSASAKGKAQKFPSVSSSPQSATTTDSAPTIQEAAVLAKQQLGIR